MEQMSHRQNRWFSFIMTGILFSVVAAGCAKKVETAQQTVPSPQERVSPATPAPPPIAEQRPSVQESEIPPATAKPAPAISLEDVPFDYDKSVIRPDAKAILERTAKMLQANSKLKVQIEGHCDERGTSEYNLVLGERRAKATKQFLAAVGVDAKRLSTISYGEERPLCTEHDEGCYTKNRRAHFMIVK